MGIQDVLASLHPASSFMDTGVGSEAVYPKRIAMACGTVLALSESFKRASLNFKEVVRLSPNHRAT